MTELFKRLLARPGIAAELLVASLLANVLALASPLFVIQVLNRYVAHGVDGTLVTLTAGVVIAIALEFAFRRVRSRLALAVSAGPDERLSAATFGILARGKVPALNRVPAGISREAMNGVNAVEAGYGAANVGAVLDVPFALLYVAVLFLLSPILAAIAAVFLAAVFVISSVGLGTLRRPTRELTAAAGAGSGIIGTAVDHADTVRAFNAAGFLTQAWLEQGRRIQALRRRITRRQGFVQTLGQSAAALMNAAIVAIGATLVVKGELTVGVMIGANILASRALSPLLRFAQLGEIFAKARQAADLMREFSKIPLEAASGSAKSHYKGGLELRDLAFAFPGASGPLFESLSLTLAPGAVLSVIGGNGSGKTTLARLLAGILEPTRGQILVDGLDLRQGVPEWWRRQIIYLPQEPAFLNATVEENLRVNAADIGMERLNQLVDAVGLRRFLDESPRGFDEPVVSNGATLSVGTRRRLALARALATGGRLVLFDEPTEGMDAEGCAMIGRIVAELSRDGHTIVVISHDPAVVKGADAVLDLNVKPVPRIAKVPRAAERPERSAEAVA
jgi:ATP-binding cassette subfamily C protein LapB